jgi:hypothetical protein
MSMRWDETWHRLRDWTNGQGPSEKLALQVLLDQGFTEPDPSHPLGGKDGGHDAKVMLGGAPWIMAAYFPRGQQPLREITKKFLEDFAGVAANKADGMAFVTNQELTLAERRDLSKAVSGEVEIFHLERVQSILDQPRMHGIREQFLAIPRSEAQATEPPRPLPTARELLDAGVPPPGAPDHRMLYDGMLLLACVIAPASGEVRHPAARDPRATLEEASEQARAVAAEWPPNASLLASRLADGWISMGTHRWGAGRASADPETLVRGTFAAASFDTDRSVLTVDRTWATRVHDDAGHPAFHAVREPEIAAELLVALRLGAALLEPTGVDDVDVVVQVTAATEGRLLVSSERAVSGGRFGDPEGSLGSPVEEVKAHHLDRLRFTLDDLRDPYRAGEELLGPWLATFRSDLFDRLRDNKRKSSPT